MKHLSINNARYIGLIILCLLPINYLFAQTCNIDNVFETAPESRFDAKPFTVKDRISGLVWKRCSEGVENDMGVCDSVSKPPKFTWKLALQRPDLANLAEHGGYTDWRLPNINELMTLIERACASPTINETVFPNTATGYYWSSTVQQSGSGSHVWSVNFLFGYSSVYGQSSGTGAVRLVRGLQ